MNTIRPWFRIMLKNAPEPFLSLKSQVCDHIVFGSERMSIVYFTNPEKYVKWEYIPLQVIVLVYWRQLILRYQLFSSSSLSS